MAKSRFNRTTFFRPSVRLGKHGRPMRDPEGHNAGADSGQPANNGGGNNGGQGGESNANNNGGQSFDPTQFWSVPSEGGSGSPDNSGSAGNGTQSGGTQQQQQNQPTLLDRIGQMNFGNGVMTDAAIAQLAEGNTEAFHSGLNTFGQQIVQQTLREAVGIMGQLRTQMMEEVRAEMGQNFTSRENAADLLAAIPSASNPAVRPVVDSIFNQAMVVCKNDRPKAIQMTKDMMKLTATTTGNDIGLPAPSSNDSMGLPQSSNTNWLEELSGRP